MVEFEFNEDTLFWEKIWWYCNICNAQNHVHDGECQYCECQGEECMKDNCSDPNHFASDETFYPGDRVIVFDPLIYKDDKSTPISYTMRPATVICWYGSRASKTIGGYPYPSQVDVRFDHRPNQISHGHFTEHMEHIKE